VCGSDDMRPVMRNVYFKDGYMFATDAYLGIKASIKYFTDFSEDEIKLLDGKMLTKKTFAVLTKSKWIEVKEDGIHCMENNILYFWSKEEGKYPDLNKMIEQTFSNERTPLREIGLNPEYLSKLNKAMKYGSGGYNQMKLSFSGSMKAIAVTMTENPIENIKGLIMPININS
jgi:DNA polymerase III sliding clamp (beta) subunit (PCNA family)